MRNPYFTEETVFNCEECGMTVYIEEKTEVMICPYCGAKIRNTNS